MSRYSLYFDFSVFFAAISQLNELVGVDGVGKPILRNFEKLLLGVL